MRTHESASEYEPAATPQEAIAGLEATRNAIWHVDAIAGLTLRADLDDEEFESGLIQACMENMRTTLGPCCERIDKAIEMLDGKQPFAEAKRVNGAAGEQDLERAIAGVSKALWFEENGSNPATEEDSEAIQAGLRTALAILNKSKGSAA